MKSSVVAMCLFGLAGLACSVQTESAPTQVNRQPIAGGVWAPDSTNVLGMFAGTDQGGGMCTGTLIAPNLVLTARHCVAPSLNDNDHVVCGDSGFADPYPGTNLMFTTDMNMSQHSKNWNRGSDVRVPSDGNDTCGFDVALVILAKPVKDVVPAVPRIDIPVAPGELYTAIGYGNTSGTGFDAGGRMMREGLQVQCVGSTCPFMYSVQSTEWGGQTGVCQGDSGGPAMDADGKVIGVVSRGGGNCSNPTYGSVYAWRDFIIGVAQEAADVGGYDPPFWVSGVSDDPNPPVEPKTPGESTEDPQGTACGIGRGCPEGFACFASGDTTAGFCTATCTSNDACGGGLSCDKSLKVCLDASGEADAEAGGCAVVMSSEDGPVRPVPWLVGLAGLVALRRRKRRASY